MSISGLCLIHFVDLRKYPFENDFFWCLGIFFTNFDLYNLCENEFIDITENNTADSDKVFLTKISIIDFKAVWPDCSHTDSVGVKLSIKMKWLVKLMWRLVFSVEMLFSRAIRKSNFQK